MTPGIGLQCFVQGPQRGHVGELFGRGPQELSLRAERFGIGAIKLQSFADGLFRLAEPLWFILEHHRHLYAGFGQATPGIGKTAIQAGGVFQHTHSGKDVPTVQP